MQTAQQTSNLLLLIAKTINPVKKILIIDDEPRLRGVLGSILQRHGFETHLAATGQEGLSKLEAVQPDVILLDIYMPEKDGLEVLRSIPPNFRCIPVIIMSGGMEFADYLAKASVLLGATSILEKPFSPDELLEAIKLAIEKSNQSITRQH